MMSSSTPSIRLSDRTLMPTFGLGLYEAPANIQTVQLVKTAARLGYRLFDTAELYGNEVQVGQGLIASRIPRDQLFITTKLYTTAGGRRNVLRSFYESLRRLNCDYVDLYLIHAPQGGHVLEAYDTLLDLQRQGRIRSVGVSNFGVKHLEAIRRSHRPLPSVNQIELHPFTQNCDIIDYCQRFGIVLMAYSPLARGQALNDPLVQQLAQKYRRTPAQILLRWSLQNDFIPIPKTNFPQRLKENLDALNFQMSQKDVQRLSYHGYKREARSGWNPTDNDWQEFGPVF